MGSVARVDRKAFGISQDVDVRPSVDFSKLEEVIVVLKSDSEPVEKVEKIEKGDKPGASK